MFECLQVSIGCQMYRANNSNHSLIQIDHSMQVKPVGPFGRVTWNSLLRLHHDRSDLNECKELLSHDCMQTIT